MKKLKKYLNKFNFNEKLIAFFISISISYITIKSLLLQSNRYALQDGVFYFFISLFLYFFISLFLIEKHISLTNFLVRKIAKTDIKLNKRVINNFIYPSFFLAISFIIIFIVSSYQVYLSLQSSSDFITNNSIAQDISSKYALPLISIYLIFIIIFQIINLSKIREMKISTSIIPTIFTLIITTSIFFVLTKVLLAIYWIIIIFTGPWVPG